MVNTKQIIQSSKTYASISQSGCPLRKYRPRTSRPTLAPFPHVTCRLCAGGPTWSRQAHLQAAGAAVSSWASLPLTGLLWWMLRSNSVHFSLDRSSSFHRVWELFVYSGDEPLVTIRLAISPSRWLVFSLSYQYLSKNRSFHFYEVTFIKFLLL